MRDNVVLASIKVGIYRHYKGQLYKVLGVANHSETQEKFVIYQALYDSQDFGANAFWARPVDAFLQRVEVNGKEIARFEWVPEASGSNLRH